MKFTATILGMALFGLVAGCEAVQFADKNTTDPHALYTARCAKCHEFYSPQKYSKPDWDKWMTKMRRKARLNEQQYEAIKEYTESLRSGTAESQKKR